MIQVIPPVQADLPFLLFVQQAAEFQAVVQIYVKHFFPGLAPAEFSAEDRPVLLIRLPADGIEKLAGLFFLVQVQFQAVAHPYRPAQENSGNRHELICLSGLHTDLLFGLDHCCI